MSLNRTSAVRAGFDQVGSFAGLGIRLSKHADLEAGYFNEYVGQATGDPSNHSLSLLLVYRIMII